MVIFVQNMIINQTQYLTEQNKKKQVFFWKNDDKGWIKKMYPIVLKVPLDGTTKHVVVIRYAST